MNNSESFPSYEEYQAPERPMFLPSQDEFYHMITNIGLLDTSQRSAAEERPAFDSLYGYLRSITIGDGKKAYCPFTRYLEYSNGYYVNACNRSPGDILLRSLAERMEAQFNAVQSTYCNRGDNFPYTTMAVTFSHPETCEYSFFDQIETFRQHNRLNTMERGLAIAIAHPLHPVGPNNNGSGRQRLNGVPLLRSETPVMLLRMFHPTDRVFMKEPTEEIPTFERFINSRFPDSK